MNRVCGRLCAGERPNFIVIYSDDHGWADLGVQGLLEFVAKKNAKGKGFLTNSQLKIASPVVAKVSLKSTDAGQATIAWRTSEQKDFFPKIELLSRSLSQISYKLTK